MLYRFLSPLAAAAVLCASVLPASAAVILEKSVDVEIRPDGGIVERSALRVRLDEPADLAAWSPYPIYFDENRKIEAITAYATRPDGKILRVPEREIGTAGLDPGEPFRSSSKVRTVRFPEVPAGSILTIETTASQRSEFRADGISLATEKAPIERLRVAVRGGGRGWRWRIGGSRAGLAVQESEGGVVVTGTSLPALKKERFAPGDRSRGPFLRFAWGEEATWAQVGRWYEGLLAAVPPDSGTVRRTAGELAPGRKSLRERLASLLGFVRGKVRYVAADAAIAGHQPSPPGEVLARGWGDCKDKALLLVTLLRETGVEAYPALIHLGTDDRIDTEFPSPFQFNHVIVAVAATGIAAPGDPVAGGFLFVDPTQAGGSVRWLHPAAQDQDALVVRGGGSGLVRTPIRQEIESGRIEARLTLTPDGDAEGEASFEISGDTGAAFADAFAGSGPGDIEQAVRQIFGQLLPGAEPLPGTVDDPRERRPLGDPLRPCPPAGPRAGQRREPFRRPAEDGGHSRSGRARRPRISGGADAEVEPLHLADRDPGGMVRSPTGNRRGGQRRRHLPAVDLDPWTHRRDRPRPGDPAALDRARRLRRPEGALGRRPWGESAPHPPGLRRRAPARRFRTGLLRLRFSEAIEDFRQIAHRATFR